MKGFFLDLVHDLRSKRLLPVAGLLLLALVVIPVALRSNGDSAAPSSTPVAGGAPGSAAANDKPVVTADANVKSSHLGAYGSKDPFKSPKPATSGQTVTSTTTPPSSGGGDNGAGSSPASGGSPTPSGPNLGGGTGPSLGGGTSPSGPSLPTQPRSQTYTYTVDVSVGKRDAEKTHHDVQRLDVLPNDRQPLFVFLGVNSTRTTAIFLIDSSLQADGEGRCKPDSKTCSFLYLKVDKDHNEEQFIQTDETGAATEWTLKLLKINRVALANLAKKPTKAQADRAAKRAHALRKRQAVPFHFLFDIPAFADEQG